MKNILRNKRDFHTISAKIHFSYSMVYHWIKLWHIRYSDLLNDEVHLKPIQRTPLVFFHETQVLSFRRYFYFSHGYGKILTFLLFGGMCIFKTLDVFTRTFVSFSDYCTMLFWIMPLDLLGFKRSLLTIRLLGTFPFRCFHC